MKKQSANKLAFNKAVVTELNGFQLSAINGGGFTTTTIGPMTIISCTFCISSSNGNFTQMER